MIVWVIEAHFDVSDYILGIYSSRQNAVNELIKVKSGSYHILSDLKLYQYKLDSEYGEQLISAEWACDVPELKDILA